MCPKRLHQETGNSLLLLAKPCNSMNDLNISHDSRNILCNFVLCPLSGTVTSPSLSIAVSDTSAVNLLSAGRNLPHWPSFNLKSFVTAVLQDNFAFFGEYVHTNGTVLLV